MVRVGGLITDPGLFAWVSLTVVFQTYFNTKLELVYVPEGQILGISPNVYRSMIRLAQKYMGPKVNQLKDLTMSRL